MAVQKFLTGYRLFAGERLNQLVDIVNGVTAGVFKGTANFTSLTTASFINTGPAITSLQLAVAAGSNSQSGSTPITKSSVIVVTVSATTRAVRLPTAATGVRVWINNGATTNVKVYPGTNDKIGAAATNAVGTAIAGNKGNVYTAQDSLTWRVTTGA